MSASTQSLRQEVQEELFQLIEQPAPELVLLAAELRERRRESLHAEATRIIQEYDQQREWLLAELNDAQAKQAASDRDAVTKVRNLKAKLATLDHKLRNCRL